MNLLSRRAKSRPEINANRFTPLSIAVALALNTPMVIAAEQNLNFNIPAQALGSALNAYADVANVQLSYPAELTNGLRSSGVSGALTAQQALQRLLMGTGLGVKVTANGSITLEKISSSQVVEELGTINVTAKADENDPANPVYSVKKSSTGTKTDTPIFDTPASIQVVPKAVMQDKKAVRLKDALENVSGVKPQSSLGFGTSFIIRGFKNDRTYRNGLLANNTFYTEFDTANLESVEVLKGPASVLYGRSEPGGMVNITTKKPLDTPYYSL
ncbi:MAG: TonB-dependent siderophore receptor, partial [Methylomonas sp.]